MKLTRRDLGKLAAAAIPGAELFAASQAWAQRAAKPNSKVAGVQIGLNVPYNFGGRDMNPDELLDRILKLNVNAVEMRSQPVENFLGSPAANGQKADAERCGSGGRRSRWIASPRSARSTKTPACSSRS